MEISKKLKLNSLLVLIFLSLNIVIAMLLIQRMTVDMHQLIKVAESLNEATLEMEINTLETAQAVLNYTIDHENRHIEKMHDSERDFRQFAKKFKELAGTEEEQLLNGKIIDLYNEFEMLGTEIASLSKQQHANLQVIHKKIIDIDKLIDEKLQPTTDRSAAAAIVKIEDVLEMEINIGEAFTAIKGYILNPTPKLRQKVADSIEDFQHFETQYRGTGLSDDEDKWIDQIDKGFAKAMTAGNEIFILTDQLQEKLDLFEADLIEIDRILDEEVQVLIHEKTVRAEDNARRSGRTAIISLFVIGLFVITIVAFVGWFVSKGIVDAADRLTEGAEELIRGNLDHHIEVKRKDELGLLAGAFNKMAQSRKKTENELKNLAKFPSENPNPVLRIARDGKLLYANAAAKSLVTKWGCQAGETICENCQNITADALQKGIEQRTEIEHDGKIFSFTIAPVIDADYANLYGSDITERKKTRQQLEIAKERAEAASTAKSQFLANMSHEIRTPISVITGFSDILITEELTKNQLTYAELIRNAGKSLLTIINDILDYSKIEAGKLNITPANHSLKAILDDIDNMMRPLALKKNLNFEVNCSQKLPDIIQTDYDRLNQCLVNLVNNAIKFTNAGHVHINVSKEGNDTEPFIRFDIEDTGIGIPADDQEHLFDSFTQVEKGSTRKYGGTGLGLAITNRLAQLLGGELTFMSQESKGSTFALLIPTGIDITTEPSLQKDKPVSKIFPTKEDLPLYSGSVLIAEDDKSCQVLTTELLERMGLDITTADDGKEAIEKSENQSFDLIFMDVRMPNLNGLEATKILRKNKTAIPIIALTAHAMEGDRKLCIKAGCDEYLSKPINHRQLIEILDRHLPAKKRSQAKQ